MTYSIIGTGNIAWFLARRLSEAGYKCAGVYGRDAAKAKELADAAGAQHYSEPREMKDGEAEVCFVALSDDAIGEVAQQLNYKQTVLAHTAGSVAIDVLKDSAVHYGVLWPLYSISRNKLPEHRQIPCFWEASTETASEKIQEIAQGLTDILHEAKEEQRRWLHLSAVISNNFSNHLMTICEEICKRQGLPFSALQPIIAQTFERIKTESPYEIQTGPARRGDSATIERHLHLLSATEDWRRIYAAISTSIENMYNVNAKEKDAKP